MLVLNRCVLTVFVILTLLLLNHCASPVFVIYMVTHGLWIESKLLLMCVPPIVFSTRWEPCFVFELDSTY